MQFKTIVASLAIGLATVGGLAATSDSANAKGGGKHFIIGGGHHHHHFRHRYFYPVVVSEPGCGVYWHRWEVTGNPYWKRRYYRCID